MQASIVLLCLIMSCGSASDTVLSEKFLCAAVEEGLKNGYLCDTGPLIFHFKDDVPFPDNSTVTCGNASYLIRTEVQFYQTNRSENVVFVYSHYIQDKGLMRVTYMTYCAGTRIEGQFTWNESASVTSDWQIVTITK